MAARLALASTSSAAARRADRDFARQVSAFQTELTDWIKKLDNVGAERALSSTGRRIRTKIVRELAGTKQVQQAVLRKKVNFFIVRRLLRQTYMRVWIGLRAGIPVENVSGAYYDLGSGAIKRGRRTLARPFRARMPNGYDGLFTRRPGGKHRTRADGTRTQLPIDTARLYLQPEALPILDKQSEWGFETILPKELERQAKLFARTGFKRSRNRR
jgi:hypothetical protein